MGAKAREQRAPAAARTVFIVEDHDLMRRMLRRLVEAQEDFVVVGEAASAEDALLEVGSRHPELVLVDVGLPGMGGIEMIAQLRDEDPDLRFVVVSAYEDPASRRRALAAGAHGFVGKSTPSRLVPVAREVLGVT